MWALLAFFSFLEVALAGEATTQSPEARDLVPQAITVYRNPEFFKYVHYEADGNYYEFSEPYGNEGKFLPQCYVVFF